MKHLALFNGIGGFQLAASWVGWDNVAHVEINEWCNEKVKKHFPESKCYLDIKDFNGKEYAGQINIITGGFPCQPFSVAGKQKGKGDDRHLWPEMFRVIREVRPPWIVGENVPGIIRMELENICLALESEGYEVQPFIIPSASIGAWDKRERVWIVAYNHSFRRSDEQKENRQPLSNRKRDYQAQKQKRGEQQCRIMQSDTIAANDNGKRLQKSRLKSGEQEIYERIGTEYCDCITPDTISSRRENRLHRRESERTAGECVNRFKKSDWWERDWIEVASELCRSNARVSNRVDRIKALGNSVNPYVPYQIFKAIEQINEL